MLRLVIILLSIAGALAGTCTLFYNAAFPGVFTRKFGSNSLILNVADGKVIWDDTLSVKAYCTSGFKGYSQTDASLAKELIYSCSGNNIYYKKTNLSGTSTAYNNGMLSCATESQFIEAKIESCPYYGLAFGFIIESQPVILADVCYDLNTMRPHYVHYVAGPRTAVVENQVYYNPPNVTINGNPPVDITFDKTIAKAERDALSKAVAASMPLYADFIFYDMLELIPLKTSVGLFSPYTTDFNDANLAAWWRPLKYGNWKGVENAIADISANTAYEVYAGTSGVVTYPLGGKFLYTDRLTYKVNQYIRNVPLYMWNFVKEKGNSKDDGVVIVGVNSPFFDVSNSSQVLCEDICDSIDWMSSLDRLRKVPTLGYVFCCSPKTVVGKLENLPF